MVANVTISESNGAGPTVTASVTNVNMGSTDAFQLVAATYPIAATGFSYEKWHRLAVASGDAGGSSGIRKFKVWASAGLGTGCTHKTNARETTYGGAQTYNTPAATDRSATYGYTQTMPTSTPTNANLGYGGTLDALMDLTSGLPKWSDYLVSQIATSGATTGTTVTMNYQYDEIA